MSDNSLTGILSDWDGLLSAVEAHREDLSNVEPCRVQLEAGLMDLRALHARRGALQAELRQSTRDLRDLVTCGRDLAARVRYGVRSRYGARSDKLTEFGIRPSRKGRSPRGRPVPGSGEKGPPGNPIAR